MTLFSKHAPLPEDAILQLIGTCTGGHRARLQLPPNTVIINICAKFWVHRRHLHLFAMDDIIGVFDGPDPYDYPRLPTYLVDVLRRHTGRSIAPYASNATVDVIASAYENLDDTD